MKQGNPDGGLDFEVVNHEEAQSALQKIVPEIVLTPEEMAEQQATLDKMYKTPEPAKPKPQDLAKIQQIQKSIKDKEAQESQTILPSIKMDNVRSNIPSMNIRAGDMVPFVNEVAFEQKIVNEVSGGMIRYVPSSSESTYGFEFEGKGEIPQEKVKELVNSLKASENEKSREVFDYLKIPKKSFGSEWIKDVKLNNPKSFKKALEGKMLHNKHVQKNILFTTATGTATAFVGTVAAIAMAGPGTVGAITALTVGGPVTLAVLGIGSIGLIGKKMYDSYKNKKCVKNFLTASVAQNMKGSLKNMGVTV